MTLKRIIPLAAIVVLGVTAVACSSRGPAEAALKAAEESVTALGDDAKNFASEQYEGLSDALADVRQKFEAGEYAEVLTAAQALPARAQEVAQAAAAKKSELTAQWTELSGSLPTMMSDLQAKVDELTKMRRLPRGMDKATVEAAAGQIESLSQMWTEASAAFQGGNIQAALSQASELKSKAEALMGQLTPAS
jgi:HAMP domain-containing protein